jgi:hypothetical protein
MRGEKMAEYTPATLSDAGKGLRRALNYIEDLTLTDPKDLKRREHAARIIRIIAYGLDETTLQIHSSAIILPGCDLVSGPVLPFCRGVCDEVPIDGDG